MLLGRKRFLFGCAAAVVVLVLGASAGAAPFASPSGDESYRAWFVQLRLPYCPLI